MSYNTFHTMVNTSILCPIHTSIYGRTRVLKILQGQRSCSLTDLLQRRRPTLVPELPNLITKSLNTHTNLVDP